MELILIPNISSHTIANRTFKRNLKKKYNDLLGQSDSGSVRFLKAGPLSLFEFVLMLLLFYISACLFNSIKLKYPKKKPKLILLEYL